MKENDIILNMLANPKFTLEDFQAVGLNSDNTGLQSEDKYLESDKIKTLINLITSQKVKDYINDNYGWAAIPAF